MARGTRRARIMAGIAARSLLADAPVNTVLPVISGDPIEGETLTTTNGTWSNSPDAYTYQWKADGVSIGGAVASSYVLTESEIGAVITVTVAATNEGGSSSATSAEVGPVEDSLADVLDDIGASPTSAFSAVRRLRAAYGGNLIRVRRSSDNTEQDIGFDPSGLLDQSALTTFVGGGNGFVVTLYDQSGSGRNLTMVTAARQPRIVASGVVETLNSNPCMDFVEASAQRLESSVAMSSLFTNSAYSYLIGMKADQGGTGGSTALIPAVLSDAPNGYFNLQLFDDTAAPSIRAANYDTNYDLAVVTVTYPKTAVVGVRLSGGTLRNAVNGGTEGTATSGNMGNMTGTLQMGSQYSDGRHFDGQVCELVTYNSALSTADLNTIGAAMAVVTGTTWTTVA